MLKILEPRVNNSAEAVPYIDTAKPFFGWKLSCGTQCSFRIEAASSENALTTGDLIWDSGIVNSSANVWNAWGGSPLSSRKSVFWRVTVWTNDGESATSEVRHFHIGLLDNSDWQGNWMFATGIEYPLPGPCAYFRRKIHLDKTILRAVIYIAARGLYDCSINGTAVSTDKFMPGWTDYAKRVPYAAIDVTQALQTGDNVIGVILGDGWYCSTLPGLRHNYYGKYPELLVQLELEYSDGSTDTVADADGWRVSNGPILYSDIFDGEYYDARCSLPGWNTVDFDDSGWKKCLVGAAAAKESARLVIKTSPAARDMEILKPVAVTKPAQGVSIFDFGRNICGYLRITFPDIPTYDSVRMSAHFSEELYPNGFLYTENYRNALATDYYVSNGKYDVWQPTFSYRGFRYASIRGANFSGSTVDNLNVKAVYVHAAMPKTGKFLCGNRKINQLISNINNSLLGNFLEVPTDCPQRDERLGWTGDLNFFFETAAFFADIDNFLRKFMFDISDGQTAVGSVGTVAPWVISFRRDRVGWSDALITLAWGLYEKYGDKRPAEENFDAIKLYLNYMVEKAPDLMPEGNDHLELEHTPWKLIGAASMKYNFHLAANIAKLLGKMDDYRAFKEMERRTLDVFRKNFVDKDGLLKVKTQTAYSMFFRYGLADEEHFKENADCFEALVRAHDNHPSTGFMGTAILCDALVIAGKYNVACDMVFQESYPSWLYQVNLGATSVWERWNSKREDGTFDDPTMNSFNHFANGAVGNFLVSQIGGVKCRYTEDGTCEIDYAIVPDKRFGFASSTLQTPNGEASSEWRMEGGKVIWNIVVPPNTTGRVKAHGHCLDSTGRFAPGSHTIEFQLAAQTK